MRQALWERASLREESVSMPSKRPPDPPQLDWREFVDEMRTKRLHREFNRPTELLRKYSVKWRDPAFLRKWDWRAPPPPDWREE